MLKICEDNIIFYITHAKYFDVLCFFVIFLSIALIILIKNEQIFKSNKKLPKVLIIISSGLFVAFLIFLLVGLIANSSFNGCASKYNENWEVKINRTISTKNNLLKQNKIIVVGDSRMEFIDDDKDIVKPFNLEFIALSGSTIKWLKSTALPKLKKELNKNEYTYHVIFNMGVNDLDTSKTVNVLADNYLGLYEKIVEEYSNVNFYFLSVNPIDEETIKSHFPGKRTNKRIQNFNKFIKNEINDFDNAAYCDSYNEIKFEIPDGLHYSQSTNRKIVNYIVNKCVKF